VREQIVIKLVVPMPLARKRIEDLPGSANSTLVDAALSVPNALANTDKPVVNNALASPDVPANTETVPAKFSPKNAADDKLITTARVFKMLTKDEQRAIYQALKDQAAPDIGTKLPRRRAASNPGRDRRPPAANPGVSLRGSEGSRALSGDRPNRSGRLCGLPGYRSMS
jgi:hypothetical protein